MNPGGRVLAAEIVLDRNLATGSRTSSTCKFSSASPAGERTKAEFHRLFRSAGLRLTRILSTGSMFSLIEGVALEDSV